MRLFLSIGLIVPAGFLFIELRDSIEDRVSTTSQELLGVEYLRALEPLAGALAEAQSAAIAGATPRVESTSATLRDAVAAVAAVDARIGVTLGVSDRWANLRAGIEALPKQGEPRALYTRYQDVTELELTLTDRVARLSGLAVDSGADTYYLHQAVTTDLPELIISTGRLADLAALNEGGPTSVADLAGMVELQEDAGGAATQLVETVEAAATGTTDAALVNRVFGPLDAVRSDLDRLAAASDTIADGEVTSVDAEVIATLRENLAKAGSTLASSILDELATILTQRRDDANREHLLAVVALAFLAALALLPALAGVRNLLRFQRSEKARERLDNEGSIGSGPLAPLGSHVAPHRGPQWSREPADAGRERADAAR